jgi:hypothetical protein
MNKNREKIQKEALELTLSHKRCGLGISMGVGKTRIAIQHLIKNYNVLFEALSREDKQKLVMIIDDCTYKDLEEEIEYIAGFKNVLFVSLFRYKFEDCVKFH